MKKIMFNDSFGLTEAVLQGRKTVTRRITQSSLTLEDAYRCGHTRFKVAGKKLRCYTEADSYIEFNLPFYIGEIVAVAQNYHSCGNFDVYEAPKNTAGWSNKMFVKAELMPHQIRILDIRAERLQDITEKDCLREYPECDTIRERHINKVISMEASIIDNWMTRREVFAWLIDKISGKGTWNYNPYVWRIEFELVKVENKS